MEQQTRVNPKKTNGLKKNQNSKMKILLINAEYNLTRLIECRDNSELQDYDLIIIQNNPKINSTQLKQILRTHKHSHTIQINESNRTTTLINKNTKAKIKNTNMLKLNNTTTIIITYIDKLNFNKDLEKLMKQLKENRTEHEEITVMGIIESIEGENLDHEEIRTLINTPSLREQNYQIKDIEKLYRGRTLRKTLDKMGWTIITTTDNYDQIGQEHKIIILKHQRNTTQQHYKTQNESYQAELLINANKDDKDRDIKATTIIRKNQITKEQFDHYLKTHRHLCNNWSGRNLDHVCDRMNKLSDSLYTELIRVQTLISHQKPIRQRTKTKVSTRLLDELSKHLTKMREYKNSLENQTDRHAKKILTANIKRKENKVTKIQNQLIKDLNKHAYANKYTNTPDNNPDLWDRIEYANQLIEGIEDTNENLIENQQQLESTLGTKFPTRTRKTQAIIERLTRQQNENTNTVNGLIRINEQEIERALYELRKKTYTGVEGINFTVFLEATKYLPEIIYTICKMSFYLGVTPNNCRTTLGNLIPKKTAGQYRIVHISTPMASLLEQIALHRLEYRLEKNNLYNPRQYGFVALKDRHDLICRTITMTKEYETTNDANRFITIIGLDIDGAFDNVDQDVIIKKLMNDLKPDNINIWLANFILYRYIIVRYNNLQSEKKQIFMGVPQGSALGPILWNFTINQLDLDIRKHNRLELLAYADDIILVHKSSTSEHTDTQHALNKLVYKLKELKLHIRAEKCSTIYINNRSAETQKHFQIEGKNIGIKNHINILGVQITNQIKLKMDNEELKYKLTNTISKLNTYKEMKVTKSIKDWKILIDSLIKSRIIENNTTILATDYEACKWCDKILLEIYQQLFKWKDTRTQSTIRYITESYNTFHINKGALLLKSMQHHNTEIQRYITTIVRNNQQTNPSPQNTEEQSNWIIPENLLINNDDFQINKDCTGYNKKRYFNPNTKLNIVTDTNNRVHQNIIWIIDSYKEGCIITRQLGESELTRLKITHQSYKIDYFNKMAALWYLTSDEASISDRVLLMNKTDAIIMALKNTQNHDWRIIQLREKLHTQKWTIHLTEKTKIREMRQQNNTQATTTIINYNNPEVTDYTMRHKVSQYQDRLLREMNLKLCPPLVKELQSMVEIETWQKINYQLYRDKHMLMLSGYYKTGRNSEWTNIERTPREWIGCSCRGSKQKLTTLHRLLECHKFTQLRQDMQAEIEELNNKAIRDNAYIAELNLDEDERHKHINSLKEYTKIMTAIIFLKVLTKAAEYMINTQTNN